MVITAGFVPYGFAAAAAALALLICVNRERLAEWLDLFDHPDGVRKRHLIPLPLVGGIAILAALSTSIVAEMAFGMGADRHLQLVLVLCGLGVGLVGFADDQRDLGAPARIFLLVVFAAIALALDPRLFPAVLHWTRGTATPVSPAVYAVLFAVAAVGIVNAINMADGRNGLVGSMFLTWSFCLLLWGSRPVTAGALAIAAATPVFLVFNLGGKLFLGDCGSYGGAFAIGIMAASAHANARLPLETIAVWFCLPVLDCLRLIAIRIAQKRSPFSADTEHLHHYLERRFGRGPATAIYISAVSISSLLATFAPQCSPICLGFLTIGFGLAVWPEERNERSVRRQAKPEPGAPRPRPVAAETVLVSTNSPVTRELTSA